jgi:peptidoglycan hydrolase-like protein with peptidoglycan-binding domain
LDVNQLQFEPRRSKLRYVIPGVIAVPVIAIAVLLLLATTSDAKMVANERSLAAIQMPFGGGTIESVSAIAGKEQKAIKVTVSGNQVWPDSPLKQGEKVTILAKIKRPGWVSWASGTEKLRISETTPAVQTKSAFVTRKSGQPIRIDFDQKVMMLGTHKLGTASNARRLNSATDSVKLDESADAGSLLVSASPRTWEQANTTTVSWFPAGSGATAVASPAPGSKVQANSPIRLTFSKPVSEALAGHMPTVTPAGSGKWVTLDSHTIKFVPSGYGYGLGTTVSVRLPSSVHLIGGKNQDSDPVGSWSVPGGSTEALQALLAELGYLPLNYTSSNGGSGISGKTPAALEREVISPLKGGFKWRWANTPATLKSQWSPTNYTEITKAAIMTFEDNNDMTVDGVPGPSVWKAVLQAVQKQEQTGKQAYNFGYTYVFVHEDNSATPSNPDEWETTWHDGKDVVHGPVNTGVTGAQTQLGTFAVFEHLLVTTMTGTNVNGSTYSDPGIKWVSYFNGGDALHEYPRASYGWPQSEGCSEMPEAEAQAVWPYTPIGTVVQVSEGSE